MNNEDARQTLQTIHTFTQFSDAKAGVLITLQTGAMIYFVSAALPIFEKGPSTCALFLWKFLVVVACCLSIAAVAAAIISIYPRLDVGQPESNIFFGHVGKYKSAADYVAKVQANTPPYIDDLLNQIWASGKIAWEKYFYIAWSIRLGLISLAIFVVPWLFNLIVSVLK